MQASWIDSDELRALAAALQEPVEETHEEEWAVEPLLDDPFIPEFSPSLSSFAASAVVAPVSEPTVELQALHDQLNTIREEARAAGWLPVVQEEPAPVVQEAPAVAEASAIPEQPIPEAPVLSEMSLRLRSFQQFATELTSCRDLLLMNGEGDLLWGNTQHQDIMATIAIAMRYHNPTAFEATHFKLANVDDTLVVVSAPTHHGQVFLTLLNAANTDERRLQQISDAMVAAVEGTPAP